MPARVICSDLNSPSGTPTWERTGFPGVSGSHESFAEAHCCFAQADDLEDELARERALGNPQLLQEAEKRGKAAQASCNRKVCAVRWQSWPWRSSVHPNVQELPSYI